MKNKRIIIFLAIVISLIIINMIIGLFSPKTKQKIQIAGTPTPISQQQQNNQVPPPVYDEKKVDALITIVETRPTLQPDDTTIRQRLVNSLGKNTTILQKTSTYQIEYLSAPNIFQVEIDTIAYEKAKTEATAWFKSQGLSQTGICKLPIQFYLRFDILQQAKQNGNTINPLPEGC